MNWYRELTLDEVLILRRKIANFSGPRVQLVLSAVNRRLQDDPMWQRSARTFRDQFLKGRLLGNKWMGNDW